MFLLTPSQSSRVDTPEQQAGLDQLAPQQEKSRDTLRQEQLHPPQAESVLIDGHSFVIAQKEGANPISTIQLRAEANEIQARVDAMEEGLAKEGVPLRILNMVLSGRHALSEIRPEVSPSHFQKIRSLYQLQGDFRTRDTAAEIVSMREKVLHLKNPATGDTATLFTSTPKEGAIPTKLFVERKGSGELSKILIKEGDAQRILSVNDVRDILQARPAPENVHLLYNYQARQFLHAELMTEVLAEPLDAAALKTLANTAGALAHLGDHSRIRQVLDGIAHSAANDKLELLKRNFQGSEFSTSGPFVEVVAAISALGKGAMPVLRERRESDPIEVRSATMVALAQLGDSGSTLAQVIRAEPSITPRIEVTALSLAETNGALLSHLSEGTKDLALKELISSARYHTDPSLTEHLQRAATAAPDLALREQLQVEVMRANKSSFEVQEKLLREIRTPDGAREATTLLLEGKDPRASALIRERLNSPALFEAVRLALAESPSPSALPLLLDSLNIKEQISPRVSRLAVEHAADHLELSRPEAIDFFIHLRGMNSLSESDIHRPFYMLSGEYKSGVEETFARYCEQHPKEVAKRYSELSAHYASSPAVNSWHRKSFETSQRTFELGILHPSRFHPEVLEELLTNRTKNTPDDRPLAIVVMPTADHEGVFYTCSDQIADIIIAGYRVMYYEASSDLAFKESISQATQLESHNEQKADLLYLGGHGSAGADALYLGNGEGGSATIDWEDKGLLSEVKRHFNDGCQVILMSCKAGFGGEGALNVGNLIRTLLPHAEPKGIWSPTQNAQGIESLEFAPPIREGSPARIRSLHFIVPNGETYQSNLTTRRADKILAA